MMVDQKKPGWWSSLPGLLAAASGFVAALTGLVAALNQLGVFARDESPRQEVTATAPVARGTGEPEEHTATPPGESAAARPPTEPPPPVSARPSVRAPALIPPAAMPERTDSPPGAAPEDSVRRDTIGRDSVGKDSVRADSAAAPQPARRVVPARTTLELVATERVCAPRDGQARFTARLARPVPIGDDTLATQGVSAVLYLRRRDGRNGIEARLDSLAIRNTRVRVRRAEVTPRPSTTGWCLPAGARLSAVLGSPVALPPR